MFNKNVFTQTDVVADLIKGINEADYKAKMEALKGNQHKIDKNKNNKIDAHDFKILRGEKKPMKEESVEEANNPFDYKNYKSQIPTKPGEKAGFDSKKISTGTVYSRKPVKDDEPVKKEEIDPDKVTTDTLSGRVKGKTSNPFAPKKVMIDVAGNVKEEIEQVDEFEFTAEDIENFMQTEEYEQLDELSKNTLKRYSDAANKDFSKNFQHDQNFTGVHSALRTAMAKTNSGAGGFDPLKGRNKNPLRKHDAVQAGLKTAADAVTAARAPFKHKMKVRNQGMHRAVARLNKEEVEQMDERTLSKGETAEKERIVKGMKKSLAGFKERYGKDAKSVMYATATKAAKKD
jgi:hypothetical protein